MTDPNPDFAAGFESADRSVWREAVDAVLRGRDFGATLVSQTRDGLEIQPLYTADDVDLDSASTGITVAPDRVLHGWDIRQRHDGESAECNRTILKDLEGGATSIELDAGLCSDPAGYLTAALSGVQIEMAPVALAPHNDLALAVALVELAVAAGAAPATKSWLGLDPLGGIARGDEANGLAERVAETVRFAASSAGRLPSARVLTVDTTRYADAGATEAQQLAASLSTGVAYLRALESAGVAPTDAAGLIGFRFAATADQFMTMATLRAARRLWARVLEASGVPEAGRVQAQQAVTSAVMFSRRDPWVNLLRATTAALAAGAAGADSVTVLPFDSAIGEPDALGHRTARNIQSLLIHESNIARFVDPGSGSWFVESLTRRLAEMAWVGFQSIETAGGVAAVLTDGSLAAEVEAAWTARLDGLSTREDPVTGVSEFPILDADPVVRPPRPDAAGWPLRRLAAPFEDLRDRSDRHVAEHGVRPTVFIAALGDLATHTARTTWVTNLLAVAGIAVETGPDGGSVSPIEAAARFGDSGCSTAVICSSDAIYADRGAATAVALRDAGASMVAMAGKPGDLRGEFESTGVDEFWHVGIDVLYTLGRMLDRLVGTVPTNEDDPTR